MEEITVHVEKPVCDPEEDACPVPLEAVPPLIDGVDTITYNEEKRTARITFNKDVTTPQTIQNTLQNMGYEVESRQ